MPWCHPRQTSLADVREREGPRPLKFDLSGRGWEGGREGRMVAMVQLWRGERGDCDLGKVQTHSSCHLATIRRTGRLTVLLTDTDRHSEHSKITLSLLCC